MNADVDEPPQPRNLPDTSLASRLSTVRRLCSLFFLPLSWSRRWLSTLVVALLRVTLHKINFTLSPSYNVTNVTFKNITIPVGHEITIKKGVVIKPVSVDVPKFLGFIPMFWVKPDRVNLEIYREGGKEIKVIEKGSPIHIGSSEINITHIKSDGINFNIIEINHSKSEL